MIPRPARTHLEVVALALERPRPPLHRPLQPQCPVLPDGAETPAEICRLAACQRREQVDEGRLERPGQPWPLLAERTKVGVRPRVQLPEERQDLVPDQPPRR